MSRLWQTFKSLPLPQLVLLGVGILVVLAMVSGGVGGCVSQMKDKAADKAIQAEKVLRQKEVERGDAWEAKAKAEESEKIKYRLVLELAEKQDKKAQEKIADAKEKFDETIAGIDSDLPLCERLNLVRAGLGLKAIECTEENR